MKPASPQTASVSAVIPCYQCSATIERAVNSVAHQTLRPLELLLVDDGSGEATIQALRQLEYRYPQWIRVIRLPMNMGAAGARNAGWNAARGKYVAFLDADDSWLPEKIERQQAFMEAHPELVMTGHLDHGVRRSPLLPGRREFRLLSRLWVVLSNPFVTPSFMVRRDIPFRFREERRHMEDHRLIQELVFAGQAVARLETRLTTVHKPSFGHAGLSADLWAMERAELANYADLRRERHIGAAAYGLLRAYSWLKFARRLLVCRLRQRMADRR